ncbi:MAG: rod shape-determining protein, partial [Candidatus Cloacimonetes bacterium]|nr:rod shape-determining protein [Candidatus Cloacimonadota bacterium]
EDCNPIHAEAMGRDLVTGLPRQITVTPEEVRDVLLRSFDPIKAILLATLEETPPELAGDLVDSGILLTGGCSQIPGIKEYFADIAQIPVHLSEVPLTSVIDGCKKMLKMTSRYFYSEV